MFDFIFGGKRKLELIRELLEQRMRESGFDDMDSKLKVKELGRVNLIGTPEGMIVTIVESVLKMQKQGALIASILSSVEGHRKTLGSDSQKFSEIINMAKGPEAGDSIAYYCLYRLDVECPGVVTIEQCMSSLEQSANEISTW